MGKGDPKTKKGKIWKGTYGKHRSKKKQKKKKYERQSKKKGERKEKH